jgi:hypothetical protein
MNCQLYLYIKLNILMKENLKRYQLKHNTELFDIDLDFIAMLAYTPRSGYKRHNNLLHKKECIIN